MKKTMTKLVSVLLVLLLLVPAVPLNAAALFSHEWIITFTSKDAARAFLVSNAGEDLGGSSVLTVGMRSQLRDLPDVESLTANDTVALCAVNDPGFSEQYYFTEELFGNAEHMFDYLDRFAPEAATVRVAVIDSGVDATHLDLMNRVAAGYDLLNDAEIPAGANSDTSAEGHGTKAAGLIAAEANNGEGGIGTAYTLPVEIVPVRAFDEGVNAPSPTWSRRLTGRLKTAMWTSSTCPSANIFPRCRLR